METELMNHIMKTYENTNSNLGILFNGIKGTGKTITAKLIAERMNLPIILCNYAYDGLAEFISKINCPCILFFDEFEKNFKTSTEDDASILSIMDGVYNTNYRRIFILTTNNLYINENLLGRPSRIRYKKMFSHLQPEIILEYIKDNLVNKKYTKEIIEFIDTLAISTIDILKSIVEEINIHDKPISEFKQFFNIEEAKYQWVCKVKCIRAGNVNYIKKDFIKSLESVDKTNKNRNGKSEVISDYDMGFYIKTVHTDTHIEFINYMEEFGSLGNIVEPIDKNGILVTEDEDGDKCFIKVLNIDSRPSLYRDSLVY